MGPVNVLRPRHRDRESRAHRTDADANGTNSPESRLWSSMEVRLVQCLGNIWSCYRVKSWVPFCRAGGMSNQDDPIFHLQMVTGTSRVLLRGAALGKGGLPGFLPRSRGLQALY